MATGFRYRLSHGRGQVRQNRAQFNCSDGAEGCDLNTKCVCRRNRMLTAQPPRNCRLVDSQSYCRLLLRTEVAYEPLDERFHNLYLL